MSIKSKTYWNKPFTPHHLRGGELTGKMLNIVYQIKLKDTIIKERIPSLYYKGKSKGLCEIISTDTLSDSISSLYATASSIVSKTLSVFAPKDHHSPAKSS